VGPQEETNEGQQFSIRTFFGREGRKGDEERLDLKTETDYTQNDQKIADRDMTESQ